jgi:hypothetical protein
MLEPGTNLDSGELTEPIDPSNPFEADDPELERDFEKLAELLLDQYFLDLEQERKAARSALTPAENPPECEGKVDKTKNPTQ